LTPAQRTKLNLAFPYGAPLEDLLSPQQSTWLADPRLQLSSGEETYREDIRQSWPALAARLGLIDSGINEPRMPEKIASRVL